MRSRPAVIVALLAVSAAVAGPALSVEPTRVPHVLAYTQTLGFHHQSIEDAKARLANLAGDGRFTIAFSDDPAVLNREQLARTDVVMWLSNTAASGRVSPFTDDQEQAYADWMSCGGGHLGVHAATDAYSDAAFPAYVEANGAIFTGHPLTATSILDDTVDNEHEGWGEPEHEILVADQTSPMTAPWHGKDSFLLKDEIYQFDRDPATIVTDYHPLLLHGSVTDPQATVTGTVYPGPYADRSPIAWTGSYRGHNRTFYTNLGHSRLDWQNADFQRHLVNGIVWTAGHPLDPACFAASAH